MSGILSPFGGGLAKQATTPAAGFALQNATPNILTWTPPADGSLHPFQVIAAMDVGSTETGGGIAVTFTLPDGTSGIIYLFGGNNSGGYVEPNFCAGISEGGQPVTITQYGALTGGASTVWAEIWGS